MKIKFEDGGHIDITKSGDNVIIIIQAKDGAHNLKTITNACELTIQQFKDLCQDIYAPQSTN